VCDVVAAVTMKMHRLVQGAPENNPLERKMLYLWNYSTKFTCTCRI